MTLRRGISKSVGSQRIRYHISKDGQVRECNARNKPCPLGEDTRHFYDPAQAQDYADKVNADKHGFLKNEDGTITSIRKFSSTMKDKESMAYQVNNLSDIQNRGFEYECYATSEYAAAMGLDTAIVINDNGVHIVGGDGEYFDVGEKINEVNQKIVEYHNLEGVSQKGLSRVIYFNPNSDDYVVQMGSPQLLDAAIISNGSIDIAEIKKGHEEGAQLKVNQVGVNEDGSFGTASKIPEIQRELNKLNISDTMGENTKIEVNNFVALEHFVQSYKDAGATKFVYTNQDEKAVFVDISGDLDEVVMNMNSKGLEVDLVLRSNMTERKLSNDDKERIKTTNSSFFKSGVTPSSNFKVGDIDRSKVSKRKDFVQLGELTLPIKYDELSRLSDDTEINYDDLKISPVYLTGTIKSKY